MFFSRLGKPKRLQPAFGVGVAQADYGAVGADYRAQARMQAADFQSLPLAQARFLGRGQFGARQAFEQRRQRQQPLAALLGLAERLQGGGVLDAETPRGRAAQPAEVGAAAERLADILGEHADIGALGTRY